MTNPDLMQPSDVPGTDLTVDQALELLPPGLRETLQGLPQEELLQFLKQALQAQQLSYKPLTQEDVEFIKVSL
jgi:hypothetical protein